MRRGEFLTLTWGPADASSAARAEQFGRRLATETDWQLRSELGGMRVWASPEGRLDVHALPYAAGIILGDLNPMPGEVQTLSPIDPAAPKLHGPLALAKALTRAHWGAFVAFLRDDEERVAAVYRDPSGDLECHSWRVADGLHATASDVHLAPSWLRPPRLALNWDRIGALLANPTAARWDPLFDGLTTVHPGVLNWPEPNRSPEPVWRPLDFAAEPAISPREAARLLPQRVDDTTAAMMTPHRAALMELSGGLDSAIVAGSLAATGYASRVVQWVNRFGDRPEGDERGYARAVTERIGAVLTEVAKPAQPFDLAALSDLTTALRPALEGADAARDGDMAARLQATGGTAILSGQGGDAIFYQMPSSLVFADALCRDGLKALASPLLGRLARRRRTSVWDVLREAWPAYRGRLILPSTVTSLLTRDVRHANLHRVDPWLVGTDHIFPGKRLQIGALGVGQVHRMDCRRRRAGDLLFPLLAQPVVELCLSVATPDLAGEEYDRPFAREVFADRVPVSILNRRSKGNLTSYFARWVAGSADVLRPFLLDGRLCAAGVLDPRKVEQALDPQQLIWAPQPGDIVVAAATEAWILHWQGRVPDSPIGSRDRRRSAP
jgi:asparagine synthase (glutamine-hydrolysing)